MTSPSGTPTLRPRVVLSPGSGSPATSGTPVAAELTRLGHRPVVLPLPGADDGATTATLDDQLAAVLAAVDAAERPVVVGHSAAA